MACASGSSAATTQPSNRMATLIEILRPALPFPAADVNGDVPVRGGESAKWFVVWPEPDDRTVVVRANPLHPDTQASGAEAMARIQEAVVAAERKAQAAYDRALKELKQTGKGSSLDGVTLEDEGVAGERIDAELELTITLEPRSVVRDRILARAADCGQREWGRVDHHDAVKHLQRRDGHRRS